MSSVFERYRRIQKRKHDCEFESSADFIRDGGVSVDVIHYRLGLEKKAGLVFNDKEGPDDVVFFTELFENKATEFVKGDYFIWDNTFYLVYEDVKLVNSNLNFKKQRAVECNVNFKLKGIEHMMGAFIGGIRRTAGKDSLEKQSVVLSQESPLLIIPLIDSELIGERISVGGKPWKVTDYDAITNLGIMYLYIEKDVYFEDSDELPVYRTELELQEEPDIGLRSSPKEETIASLIEHTVESKGGYFAATPKVEVVRRTKSLVTFMIPFHGQTLRIETKDENGDIVSQVYTVVRP